MKLPELAGLIAGLIGRANSSAIAADDDYYAKDPQHGYEIAGFVWFQGWNDMVDSGTYPSIGQWKGNRPRPSPIRSLTQMIRAARAILFLEKKAPPSTHGIASTKP
jgi:hypothetical protein